MKNWIRLAAAACILLCGLPSGAEPLPYAFVALQGSSLPTRLAVVSTAVSAVSATVSSGSSTIVQGGFSLAITPDGAFAYVANRDSKNLWVVNTSTLETVATIDTPTPTVRAPVSLAISPNGYYVYVVLSGSPPTLEVFDTSTHALVQTIALSASASGAHGIAITPDGARAYVGLGAGSMVAVIDLATNTMMSTIYMGGGAPNALAVSPDGARVYVALASAAGRVGVIDTNTNTTVATINVGAFPSAIAVTPNGSRVYVTNQSSNTVSVIDAASNSVLSTVSIPSVSILAYPTSVAITPDGNFAYVVTPYQGLVYVIDTANNVIVGTIDGLIPPPINGTIYISAHGIAFTPTPIEMPPSVSGSVATPNPTTVQAGVEITALVDDVATGGESIVAAHVNVDDGPWSTMRAEDGAFDSASESVATTIPGFASVGVHRVCVRGADAAGHLSRPSINPTEACSLVVASDPYTPVGTDVPVALLAVPPGGGEPLAVSLTFDSVSSGGQTTVAVSTIPTDGAPNAPSGFRMSNSPLYYDVETTATFSGTATLCFVWDEGQFFFEAGIALLHFIDGAWVDVTTSLDTNGNKVCGEVNSFSPFGIFERTYTIDGFFAPVDNQPTVNVVKAGAAIPVKFSLHGDQGLKILAAGYPNSRVIACDSSAPSDMVTETVAAGASGLSYDPVKDRYTYVWKSDKAWSTTCRRFTLQLTDGTSKSADFRFQK